MALPHGATTLVGGAPTVAINPLDTTPNPSKAKAEVQSSVVGQGGGDCGVPKWCHAEVMQAMELNTLPSAIHNNLKCVSSCHLVSNN